MLYQTVRELFENPDVGLQARFNREAAGDDNLAIHFVVTGCGEWCVKIEAGKLEITSSKCQHPANVTLTISEQDMLDLANGKEGIQLLFMTGKLRLEGDLPSAVKLVRYFPLQAA